MQQVRVGNRVLDIIREVRHASRTRRVGQMIVHPPDQDLLGGQLHKLLESLAFGQQQREVRMIVEIDV